MQMYAISISKTNRQTLSKCFNAFLGIWSLVMDHRTDLTNEARMDQEFIQMIDHDRDRTEKSVRSGPVRVLHPCSQWF